MKAVIVLLAFTFSFQTLAQGLSPLSQNSEVSVSNASSGFLADDANYIHARAGFGFGETTIGNRTEFDFGTQEYGVEGGLTIGLPVNLSTTSLFGARLVNISDDDAAKEFGLADEASVGYSGYEFGIAQRLNYNIQAQSVTIRPFTQVGFALGWQDFDVEQGDASLDTDFKYNKLSLGFGVQAEYANFLPEIMVEFADVNFSEEYDQTVEANGQTDTTTESLLDDAQDGGSFMVKVGVGYRFF